MGKIITLKSNDNVGNAIEDIEKEDIIIYESMNGKQDIKTKDRIPFGFKVALKDIVQGESILKYGEVIGKASRNIMAGELVHINNMEGKRGRGDLLK